MIKEELISIDLVLAGIKKLSGEDETILCEAIVNEASHIYRSLETISNIDLKNYCISTLLYTKKHITANSLYSTSKGKLIVGEEQECGVRRLMQKGFYRIYNSIYSYKIVLESGEVLISSEGWTMNEVLGEVSMVGDIKLRVNFEDGIVLKLESDNKISNLQKGFYIYERENISNNLISLVYKVNYSATVKQNNIKEDFGGLITSQSILGVKPGDVLDKEVYYLVRISDIILDGGVLDLNTTNKDISIVNTYTTKVEAESRATTYNVVNRAVIADLE